MPLINISGDPPERSVIVSCPAAVICTSTLSKFACACHHDALKFKHEHKRLQSGSVFELKSTTVERVVLLCLTNGMGQTSCLV